MKSQIKFLAILLLTLALSLTACARPGAAEPSAPSEPEPEPMMTPAPEPDNSLPDLFEAPIGEGSVFVCDGIKLIVPDEYAPLVVVAQRSPLFGGDNLFSVREHASMEAAEKAHPGEDWGEGALFGIGRMSEQEVQALLCGYLVNEKVFARDAEGNYYVYYHPTDVRLFREDMSNLQDSPDLEQWTALNEWAAGMMADFIEANPQLESWERGGSDAERMLSCIAYRNDTFFELRSLEYGELDPDTPENSAAYAKRILDGVSFEYCDESETPDGEYYVIDFPNENLRLDFFVGGDYVREDYGDYQMLLRINGPENLCQNILREWCQALAHTGG